MIEVNNVTMKFNLARDNINNIKEYFIAMLQGKISYDEFTALNNVSFKIDKGEVFGIIGSNGAGKSTLLKIIAGVLKPTEGNVIRRGIVAPMLELGAGFDIDLSAKENVFLNGALLGYSEKFLNEKYDEIVEFSGLEDFMDVPIRNFSSGMTMRLAFSIATIVVPEILLVDEILAVGDEEFSRKSYQKMQQLMSGGTTVVYVSHNMSMVKDICDRVLWLDHGSIKMIGSAESVCDRYISEV